MKIQKNRDKRRNIWCCTVVQEEKNSLVRFSHPPSFRLRLDLFQKQPRFVERPSWQTETCTSSNTAGCGALAKHVYTSTNLLTQFNGQDHVESNLYNMLKSGTNAYLDPLLSTSPFDLVLLMIPSSLPAGTAGLGYIGRSGSIVAGCEAKQDYECVHTIVHELGHNFGLRHANSPSRNYGNIYDFMGNTYAMQGTSFSAAASAEVLGWIPSSNYVSIAF